MRVHRRIRPGRVAQFRRNAWLLLRIKTRARQFQNSAESQIVANHLREKEECPFAESPRGAKSATATRGFSTPRPVLMRNQSCPNAAPAITNATAKKNVHRKNGFSTDASLCLLSSTGLESFVFSSRLA